MGRAGVILLVVTALVVLYLAAFRTVDGSLQGKPPRYSDKMIAEGAHCVDQLLDWDSPLAADIKSRITTATSVSIHNVDPGVLRADGTRKLTVHYQIVRADQKLSDMLKATGNLNNADCTYDLTIIQR